MTVQVVGAQANFVFHWPGGSELFDTCLELIVFAGGYGQSQRVYVAYGYLEAFDAMRRRILVFRDEGNALAEFVGADDWHQSKHVLTFLRRDGSKKYLRLGDVLPTRYRSFQITDPSTVLSGRYVPHAVAIMVEEADLSGLVKVALAREGGKEVVTGTALPATAPAVTEQTQKVDNDRLHAVVRNLLIYRSQQEPGGTFTRKEEADNLLRHNPFAFLMAASLDRGARAEAVWEIPFLLCQTVGHLNPRSLSEKSVEQMEGILRSLKRQPRFPRQAAQTITSLSKLVVDRFQGDAIRIWQGRTVDEILGTLQQIWGVGSGIAHMTVRILVDEFGYHPGLEELRRIDVKPDAHVVRVFYRTGLIAQKSGEACVKAARCLHPEFPALLDWPAWEIGRTWCHERVPDCTSCPLVADCAHGGIPETLRAL